MNKILCTVCLLVALIESYQVSAENDTLKRRKHQISIGTTGLYLPDYQKYSISSTHRDPFTWYQMFLSHLSYDRTINDKLSYNVSISGYRSFADRVEYDDSWNSVSIRQLNMCIISTGVYRNFRIPMGKNFASETRVGNKLQIRFGQERISAGCFVNPFPIIGPGFTVSISQNLVIKDRIVLGLNSDLHSFFQMSKQFEVDDHNTFLTNAAFLGVRF